MRSTGWAWGVSVAVSLAAVGAAMAACTSDSETAGTTPDGGPGDGAAPNACPAKDAAPWLARAGTEHDDVSTSETWKASDSPHRVPRGLVVGNGATLTIEPCALVIVGAEDDGRAIAVGAAEPTPAKGDLVAVGSAEQPILFRGRNETPGNWEGLAFFGASGSSRLSYVTMENAGAAEGAGGVAQHSSLWLTNGTSVVVDHSTFRGGAMDGIRIDDDGTFGAGSEGNTVTGMARAPIRANFSAVGGILDGHYTGNGTDRVELEIGSAPTESATWHKLSVPWHVRGLGYSNVSTTITVEPGAHVIVEKNPEDARFEGTWIFEKGGAIVADGGSAAGTIVFEGESTDPPGSWHGFELLETAGKSTFNFVKVAQAGRMMATASTGHCEDPAISGPIRSAIKLHAKGLVTITSTEIRDVGADAYAIDRDYCGGATAEHAPTNVFTGAILCGETDTMPCPSPAACDPQKTCCDHDYACGAPPTM